MPKWLKWAFLSFAAFVLLGAGLGYLAVRNSWLGYDLPTEPLNFQALMPRPITEIRDRSHRVIDYWGVDADGPLKLYRPLDRIDARLQAFVVFLEDAKFFAHSGLDVEEIRKVVKESKDRGSVGRGASTITQQLVKNLFLDQQRSFLRKFFEVPWAMRVENDFSKSQILELYLNVIEWGPGIYGAEAAARHYFDTTANALNEEEAMYLALIIPNPIRMDLMDNPRALTEVMKRKNSMVERLLREKQIDASKASYLTDYSYEKMTTEGYLKEDRYFKLFHLGSYSGSRSDRKDWLRLLEQQLYTQVSGKAQQSLSIDQVLMAELHKADLIKDNEHDSDYWLLLQWLGETLAFRKIPQGYSINEEESFLGLYDVVREQKINWSSLFMR